MAQTTDQVLGRRRTLLIAFLIGWTAWYGFFVGQQSGLYGEMSWMTELVASAIGLGGWLVFAIAMIKILNFKKKYKDDPEALAALDDELARDQNRRATTVGVYALILIQVVLVLTGEVSELNAAIGAHISIFAGVAAIMGSFLWFDLTE